MWRVQETEIERLRDAIAEDPAIARDRIEAALGESRFRRSDRIRLWGLMVAVGALQGDFEQAMDAFRQGKRIRTQDRSARAELFAQAAHCLICNHDYAQARALLAEAKRVLEPLLQTPAGRSQQSQRRYHRVRYTHAGLYVLSGQVSWYEGDYQDALGCSQEALTLSNHPRSTLAAVSLLGGSIAAGCGSPDDLSDTFRLIGVSLENRLPELHRTKLHGVRALLLARFGAIALAEKIMMDGIRTFERLGAFGELAHATEELIWIVAHRNADPGRALYLLQQMSGALDATTRAKLREQLREEIRAESAPPPARALGW